MSPPGRKDLSARQQELRATTAERLEAIVEAAERAAERVIDDAEAQAKSYLAQAEADAERLSTRRATELSSLVESLIDHAASLRREAERLQEALEDAKERIEPGEPVESEPSAAPRLRAVSTGEGSAEPVHAEPEHPPEAEQGEGRSSSAAGARLLATQMAVSGSSREEIELRLRNGFEITDPAAILDAILGPED